MIDLVELLAKTVDLEEPDTELLILGIVVILDNEGTVVIDNGILPAFKLAVLAEVATVFFSEYAEPLTSLSTIG